jgi:hypothetical protein
MMENGKETEGDWRVSRRMKWVFSAEQNLSKQYQYTF